MFNRFFKRKQLNKPRIDKTKYWETWEFFELFDQLYKAEQLLEILVSEESEDELKKFKSDFIEELHNQEGENIKDWTQIWLWFSAGQEWETLIGKEGFELSKTIFRITNHWKRNQDFLPGTKVTLDNENGVVLNEQDESTGFGRIRWDTPQRIDIEDWRGLFGSFLNSGGKVLEQDYAFVYIDDEGNLKKSVVILLGFGNSA